MNNSDIKSSLKQLNIPEKELQQLLKISEYKKTKLLFILQLNAKQRNREKHFRCQYRNTSI